MLNLKREQSARLTTLALLAVALLAGGVDGRKRHERARDATRDDRAARDRGRGDGGELEPELLEVSATVRQTMFRNNTTNQY
jgi:hypothetical protein